MKNDVLCFGIPDTQESRKEKLYLGFVVGKSVGDGIFNKCQHILSCVFLRASFIRNMYYTKLCFYQSIVYDHSILLIQ